MSDYVYQVVSRTDGGEWEKVYTKTPFFTKIGAARGAATQKRGQDEWYARTYERQGRIPPPIPEYAVRRAQLGPWEIIENESK